MSDPCCPQTWEHVHAPKKEDFEKGKVTSNRGVPHVTEATEECEMGGCLTFHSPTEGEKEDE